MYGGQCRRLGYDFQCTCPIDRDGKLCELERGDACASNPCRNGGSCRKSPDNFSFFCLCRAGYRGNHCEAVTDSCRPNPCLYGGLCVGEKPGLVHVLTILDDMDMDTTCYILEDSNLDNN
ncbi:hypothetical protein P5V15_003380 [Pogonomyrmex californicus]